MPAPLLYKMFKTKTEYPLHTAIRAKREDVVFLFLMEFDSQVCFISCLLNVPVHDKKGICGNYVKKKKLPQKY